MLARNRLTLLRSLQRRQLLSFIPRGCYDHGFVDNRSYQHRALNSQQPRFDGLDFGFLSQQKNQAQPDEEDEKQRIREEKQEALKRKTGRLWTDPWDIDDMLESNIDFDSLPDWSPKLVSRISQERVQIYSKDGSKIPTLAELAELPLPPPPPPHPGQGGAKLYALHRKRSQYKYIADRVKVMAQPKVKALQALQSLDDKQEAVDVLFEDIEMSLKKEETILGVHPSFGNLVENALEAFLKSVQENKDEKGPSSSIDSTTLHASPAPETFDSIPDPPTSTTGTDNVQAAPRVIDDDAVPVFMDCYDGTRDTEEAMVPTILKPLRANPKGPSVGRMVEEWELSAHKKSKRIMLRQSTRQIARAFTNKHNSPARVYVHGRQGVGKSAAIAAIVASARLSGSIVLYLPEGDQLHKNGFYCQPNEKRKELFDLPVLQQEICKSFLDAHESDLESFHANKETMELFFTESQLSRISSSHDIDKGHSLAELLKHGGEHVEHSPMCYSAAVDVLMKQDEKDFVLVLDEFNCFFEKGLYFHEDYDAEVKKPIPYDDISLFKPFLDAMALTATPDPEKFAEPVLMKRGSIVVGTTESHAVPRIVTDHLTHNAKQIARASESVHVVEVPRLSALEVEHMVANYEAIGVGKLRLDQGETVMNEQEVAYLRLVSGGEAQRLFNASMM